MSKVIVVGGGAAGMMSAITAAKEGKEVLLFEKNEKLGKKIYITGKGRCNITNSSDIENVFNNVVSNRKFLYSSFYGFDNNMTMEFFKALGLEIKIERGNRVFPVSDHSSDVINVLHKEMLKRDVKIYLNKCVKSLIVIDNKCNGILTEAGEKIYCDSVIVATGGISYPSTGSTGDGYKFAKACGHKITELYPSLVPFNIKESFCQDLMGLSLKNVNLKIYADKKEIFNDFGEMLFTHFGVSGPLVISASAFITKYINKNIALYIDLKPALTEEQLDMRILRDFNENLNKQFKNSIDGLVPKKLIPIIIEQSGISPDKKINEISKAERQSLVDTLKKFKLSFVSLRDYNEAIITKGGISVKEINPSTMESKIINNLFFAGEVLDLDALTGGYNLQIAWSTGYFAGLNC